MSVSSIPALPLNAIFLVLEDGGLMVEERLYMILRANGFIAVASKHTADEASEEPDDYARREEV